MKDQPLTELKNIRIHYNNSHKPKRRYKWVGNLVIILVFAGTIAWLFWLAYH